MSRVSKIINNLGGREAVAAECGLDPIAVYRWERSGAIPSKHLATLLRLSHQSGAEVTAEDLCNHYDAPREAFGASSVGRSA